MTSLRASALGCEALDRPGCDPALARATLFDIRRANSLFGGRGAAAFGLECLLSHLPQDRRLTLLDLGAGAGDVASWLAHRGAMADRRVVPIAVDRHRVAATLCAEAGVASVVGDVAALPIAERGVDLVLASQFLHHFSPDGAVMLLRLFDRIARIGVIIADLRRHPFAVGGIWLAARVLRFHPVSRHDGVLSVRRGYTASELAELLAAAAIEGTVYRRPGYRLVAVWPTSHANG